MERFEDYSSDLSKSEVTPTIAAIEVKPWTHCGPVTWRLPPSKSHLIRWLLMTSQGPENDSFKLTGVIGAGADAIAMREALSTLGVEISDSEDSWIVRAVGNNGFKKSNNGIDCANSGTAMRLLTIAVARIGEPILLDGDNSLRRRGNPEFWQQLKNVGIEITHSENEDGLPIIIRGPMKSGVITLDVNKTSQHLSALLLSMPALNGGEIRIEKVGDLVSRRHAELSFEIARMCGSSNAIDEDTLDHFICQPPTEVSIPLDASHIAFAKLFETIHGISTNIPEIEKKDAIGSEILFEIDLTRHCEVNLRDANDLITPLSAAMAIGGGGTICGASHAQYKESPRITSTVKLLASFGLEAKIHADGLDIRGGQVPVAPTQLVSTYDDHRIQMTAIILATKTGGMIDGVELHNVSDPKFLENLTSYGISLREAHDNRHP